MTRRRPPTALQVSADRVVDTVVGLRPFRRTGFRLEVERLGDKVVIHNYGHGGCGVTLSWGTAQLALQRAAAASHQQVAVLGAGAVGLATARVFQDQGFDVTIYARELPPHTTSNVAGAEWAPHIVIDDEHRTDRFDDQLVQASVASHRLFQTLVGDRYGVRWLDAYDIGQPVGGTHDRRWEGALLADLFPKTMLEPGEHAFGARSVAHYRTMHIDPSIYLDAMLTDVRRAGGAVVVRDLPDMAAVANVEPSLIVNCTGLGGRELCADDQVVPVKGQLSMLRPQPGIDYITHTVDGALYMMPRKAEIILGGTEQRGVESLAPDRAETARIVEGHRRLFAAPE